MGRPKGSKQSPEWHALMRRVHLKRVKPGTEAKASPIPMEIAFVAGFYEGEGTVSRGGGTGKSFQINICQKDPTILYEIKRLFGGVIDWRTTRGFHVNYIRMSGCRARGFLMTIYKFLSPRRQSQALKALGLCDVRLQLPDAA